jgi:hypothetical protein
MKHSARPYDCRWWLPRQLQRNTGAVPDQFYHTFLGAGRTNSPLALQWARTGQLDQFRKVHSCSAGCLWITVILRLNHV